MTGPISWVCGEEQEKVCLRYAHAAKITKSNRLEANKTLLIHNKTLLIDNKMTFFDSFCWKSQILRLFSFNIRTETPLFKKVFSSATQRFITIFLCQLHNCTALNDCTVDRWLLYCTLSVYRVKRFYGCYLYFHYTFIFEKRNISFLNYTYTCFFEHLTFK